MTEAELWRHSVVHDRGVSTITLAGELDLASGDSLHALVLEQLAAPRITRVLVDLAQVSFLDSTVLGVLIASHHSAQEAERVLVVVNPSRFASRVLTLTGLKDVLCET